MACQRYLVAWLDIHARDVALSVVFLGIFLLFSHAFKFINVKILTMAHLEMWFLVSAQFKCINSLTHFLISSLNPNLIGVTWKVLNVALFQLVLNVKAALENKYIDQESTACTVAASGGWKIRETFCQWCEPGNLGFFPKWKAKEIFQDFSWNDATDRYGRKA